MGVGVGIIFWNYFVFLGLGKFGFVVFVGNIFIWKLLFFFFYMVFKLGEIVV